MSMAGTMGIERTAPGDNIIGRASHRVRVLYSTLKKAGTDTGELENLRNWQGCRSGIRRKLLKLGGWKLYSVK